jgi:hypothetical protein
VRDEVVTRRRDPSQRHHSLTVSLPAWMIAALEAERAATGRPASAVVTEALSRHFRRARKRRRTNATIRNRQQT